LRFDNEYSHGALAFLDAGYPVRGTVRSKAKGDFLKNRFKDKKQSFDYVIVSDISEVRPLVLCTGLVD